MKKAIIQQLSKSVADTQVLWNKVHNLHWNVQGMQFKAIHEMTEAIYDELAEQFDALAERILMLGAKPPVTLADCLKLSTVKESPATTFTAGEVIDILLADLGALLKDYQTTRKLAAESDDVATDSMLTGFVEYLEKQLWMLRSTK